MVRGVCGCVCVCACAASAWACACTRSCVLCCACRRACVCARVCACMPVRARVQLREPPRGGSGRAEGARTCVCPPSAACINAVQLRATTPTRIGSVRKSCARAPKLDRVRGQPRARAAACEGCGMCARRALRARGTRGRSASPYRRGAAPTRRRPPRGRPAETCSMQHAASKMHHATRNTAPIWRRPAPHRPCGAETALPTLYSTPNRAQPRRALPLQCCGATRSATCAASISAVVPRSVPFSVTCRRVASLRDHRNEPHKRLCPLRLAGTKRIAPCGLPLGRDRTTGHAGRGQSAVRPPVCTGKGRGVRTFNFALCNGAPRAAISLSASRCPPVSRLTDSA
jgi:hypothetical protein